MLKFSDTMVYLDAIDYIHDEAGQRAKIAQLENRVEMYGTDIFTGGLGDLDTTSSGDFKRVTGLQNLAQQILHRLMTPRGEHPQDATLGIPWFDFLGQTYESEESYQELLASEIADELTREDRIDHVRLVEVSFLGPSAVQVYIEVVPIGMSSDVIGVQTRVSSTGVR